MIRKMLITAALATGVTLAHAGEPTANVVEIATFDFAEGVTAEMFAPVDARIEAEYVSQQPGFVSRETGSTETGWVVIVHWESAEDAQASMNSFSEAPAVEEFMSMLDASTMSMTHYALNP